jgi:hypothetical protein
MMDGTRNAAVLAAYRAGMTLAEVGARFGISASRVRQICLKQAAKSARRRPGMALNDGECLLAIANAPFAMMFARPAVVSGPWDEDWTPERQWREPHR